MNNNNHLSLVLVSESSNAFILGIYRNMSKARKDMKKLSITRHSISCFKWNNNQNNEKLVGSVCKLSYPRIQR